MNDDALLAAEKSDRITVQVSFSEPDLGRCGMVLQRNSPDDPVPELGGLSFGASNDNGASREFRIPRLVWRALAIWIGTALVGGAVLAAMISFVAGVFGAPEFAEHQQLGYLMAGVLGFGFAGWFLVIHLRVHRSDPQDGEASER